MHKKFGLPHKQQTGAKSFKIIYFLKQICFVDRLKQMFYNKFGDIMERQILHVDVNNAFLSWTAIERLKQGETLDIRTIPAIVGGDEEARKGVVLAKSMKAKEFGIVTGEPIYFARKKCPSVKIYSSDMKIYRYYSEQLYQLLLQYTEKIERFSIDECFLDMTEYLMGHTLLQRAYEINRRVKKELDFTVNIGVAHNKLLAKMASDFTKPDRVHTLFEKEISEKMWKLPVSELFMIGKKSVPKLKLLGIKTIGDLAKYNKKELEKQFGKAGTTMWEYANGIDNAKVCYEEEKPKGIGNSTTLPRDIYHIEELNKILLTLTEQVAYRLRQQGMLANVANVQLKNKDFKVMSHQRKINYPTNQTVEIYKQAKELLKELYRGEGIRLVGVRVDGLTEGEEEQLCLFQSQKNKKQEVLDRTLDVLRNKYGYEKITRAGRME